LSRDSHPDCRAAPNRIIVDDETVRLNTEHPLHFIAVPPAVFGALAG
jgi:hypothetical protein